MDPDGHLAWLVGAIVGGTVAYIIYKLEVYLKMRKYSWQGLVTKVAVEAAVGAYNGGMTGFWDFQGCYKKPISVLL